MTPFETRAMLTFIARFDNRDVTDELVDAWAPLFTTTDRADAKTAIQEHYTESRAWIMPADILGKVRTIRAQRLEAFVRGGRDIDSLISADPLDVRAYQAEREQIRALVMSGQVAADATPEQVTAAVNAAPRQIAAGGAS